MHKIELGIGVKVKPLHKSTDQVILKAGDATVTVSAHAAIRALLEPVLNGSACREGARFSRRHDAGGLPLPAIGAEWQGGIYAGLTLADNAPAALVLLPGDEKLKWEDAVKWAEKQGGTLPSRIDHLVLWKNLKDQFKPEWYWSAEPCAGYESSAWVQSFGYGSQYDGRKASSDRARAVRRVPIQ